MIQDGGSHVSGPLLSLLLWKSFTFHVQWANSPFSVEPFPGVLYRETANPKRKVPGVLQGPDPSSLSLKPFPVM